MTQPIDHAPPLPPTKTASGPDAARADAVSAAMAAPIAKEKKHRTRGLWLFDVLVYNAVNVGVFAVSVAATYLTSHGDKHLGEFGKFMKARGDWLTKKLEGFGLRHKDAEMGKIVFFSFADGTLFAPLVKLLEDRREKIARSIDRALGTEGDEAAYAAEPKQSWKSVIGGRLATAAIVVPIAVGLSNNGYENGHFTHKKEGQKDFFGFNDKMFDQPGKDFAAWVKKKPALATRLKGFDVPDLSKIVVFEAFYTSVCTLGLYLSSRLLAGFGKKDQPVVASEPQAKPSEAETALAKLAPQIQEAAPEPHRPAFASSRTPKGLAPRQEKPSDFRTKYEERKGQESGMALASS